MGDALYCCVFIITLDMIIVSVIVDGMNTASDFD